MGMSDIRDPLKKDMDPHQFCLKAQYSYPASPTLSRGRLLRDLAKPLTEIVALRAIRYLDQRVSVYRLRSEVQEFKVSRFRRD